MSENLPSPRNTIFKGNIELTADLGQNPSSVGNRILYSADGIVKSNQSTGINFLSSVTIAGDTQEMTNTNNILIIRDSLQPTGNVVAVFLPAQPFSGQQFLMSIGNLILDGNAEVALITRGNPIYLSYYDLENTAVTNAKFATSIIIDATINVSMRGAMQLVAINDPNSALDPEEKYSWRSSAICSIGEIKALEDDSELAVDRNYCMVQEKNVSIAGTFDWRTASTNAPYGFKGTFEILRTNNNVDLYDEEFKLLTNPDLIEAKLPNTNANFYYRPRAYGNCDISVRYRDLGNWVLQTATITVSVNTNASNFNPPTPVASPNTPISLTFTFLDDMDNAYAGKTVRFTSSIPTDVIIPAQAVTGVDGTIGLTFSRIGPSLVSAIITAYSVTDNFVAATAPVTVKL